MGIDGDGVSHVRASRSPSVQARKMTFAGEHGKIMNAG